MCLNTAGGIIPDEIGCFHPIAVGQHVTYTKNGNIHTATVKSEYTCLGDGLPVVNVECHDGIRMAVIFKLTIDSSYDPNDNDGIINFNYNQKDCGGNSIPIWKSARKHDKILLRNNKECNLITKKRGYMKVRVIKSIHGTTKCTILLNNKHVEVNTEDLFLC